MPESTIGKNIDKITSEIHELEQRIRNHEYVREIYGSDKGFRELHEEYESKFAELEQFNIKAKSIINSYYHKPVFDKGLEEFLERITAETLHTDKKYPDISQECYTCGYENPTRVPVTEKSDEKNDDLSMGYAAKIVVGKIDQTCRPFGIHKDNIHYALGYIEYENMNSLSFYEDSKEHDILKIRVDGIDTNDRDDAEMRVQFFKKITEISLKHLEHLYSK